MKTALFLGAGASAFVSQPTTKELMDRVRKRASEANIAGRGLNSITKIIVNDDHYIDVEKLYDGIDKIRGIRDIPNIKPIFLALHGSDMAFKETLDSLGYLKSIIRDILLESFVINEDARESIGRMYNVVWSVMKNEGSDGLWVFTTNYDTVIEEYSEESRFEIVNGFKQYRRLSSVWDDEWERRTDKPPLYLTKMHGSVHWHMDTDGRVVEIGDAAQRDSNRDIMIAPTEGPKKYNKEPFISLLRCFREAIKHVDVLLVIGFSYRDSEIASIIKNRVKEGMALISVSPDAADDIRRVSDDNYETVLIGGRALKTNGAGIILVEQRFGLDTIQDVHASLAAAYELVRHRGRSARQKDNNAVSSWHI